MRDGGGAVCSSTNVSEHELSIPFTIDLRARCVCGKAEYSFGEASRAIRSLRAYGKTRERQGYLVPYRCRKRPHVWHVGHSED